MVPFIELCQGRYCYESDEAAWNSVCCYRCPKCSPDPLCPLCSPSTAPEPEPEPMPEPEPKPVPGGYPSADEILNRVFEGVAGHGVSPLPPLDYQPGFVPNTWQGHPDMPSSSSGTTNGWGGWGGWGAVHKGLRNDLPMLAPGAVKLWMRDGAGGHQCIGYGGDRAYRWNEPGNHTPHEVGGIAGFWVRNQRRLDAEAAKEAEQAAAAARAAAQTAAAARAAARATLSGAAQRRCSAQTPPPSVFWVVGFTSYFTRKRKLNKIQRRDFTVHGVRPKVPRSANAAPLTRGPEADETKTMTVAWPHYACVPLSKRRQHHLARSTCAAAFKTCAPRHSAPTWCASQGIALPTRSSRKG